LPFYVVAVALLVSGPGLAQTLPPAATSQPAATDWRAGLERKLAQVIPQIDFDDTEMSSFFTFLREVNNINVVVDPDCELADKKVACHYKDTPFKTMFSEALRDKGLWYRLQDGALYVFKKSRPLASLPPMAGDAPAWEKKLRTEIGKRIPKLDFDDTELSSVVYFLRETSGVNFRPTGSELDAAGINKTTKINLHTADLTFEQNLNLICQMHRLQYRLTEKGPVIEKYKPAKTSIKVGRDTTRITGPLREDGTVDYLAAINEQYSKGVTKDNNAAVPFLQALDPSTLDKRCRNVIFSQLGLRVELLPGPFLKTSYDGDFKEYEDVIAGPWSAKDHPKLAKWIRDNETPLKVFLSGLDRPRYFAPLWIENDGEMMANCKFLQLTSYLAIGRMLNIRANLALSEGRFQDARAEILHAYRLGHLLEQDSTLIGRMVAISCGTLADLEVQRIAPTLDANAAKTLQADIRQLPPVAPITPLIDAAERYYALDIFQSLATNPQEVRDWADQTNFVMAPLKASMTSTPALDDLFDFQFTDWTQMADLAPAVDWNQILIEVNNRRDHVVEFLRSSDPESRRKRMAKLKQDKKADLKPVPKSSAKAEEKTTWVLDWVRKEESGTERTLLRCNPMVDKYLARRDLSIVALALTMYKADKGKYPSKLSELAPDYLQVLPPDIFSGKDMIYRPEGKGYILYSVGENGIDDGGRLKRGCDDIATKSDK
jgi:hypothetical protein